jgi:hypothetical protein
MDRQDVKRNPSGQTNELNTQPISKSQERSNGGDDPVGAGRWSGGFWSLYDQLLEPILGVAAQPDSREMTKVYIYRPNTFMEHRLLWGGKGGGISAKAFENAANLPLSRAPTPHYGICP